MSIVVICLLAYVLAILFNAIHYLDKDRRREIAELRQEQQFAMTHTVFQVRTTHPIIAKSEVTFDWRVLREAGRWNNFNESLSATPEEILNTNIGQSLLHSCVRNLVNELMQKRLVYVEVTSPGYNSHEDFLYGRPPLQVMTVNLAVIPPDYIETIKQTGQFSYHE
jgi:hypothetical protein